MLLYGVKVLEQAEDPPSQVTLEAASELAVVLALASAPKRVGLCLGMEVHAPHDDGVKSSIELTIPTAIQSVTNDLSGRSWDRCHAGEGGESSLRTQASTVRPGADDLGRADRADARLLDEDGSKFSN